MIVRSRRESDSLWSRIFRRKNSPRHQDRVLSDVDFAFALEKERSRCDRRDRDREFSVIELHISNFGPEKEKLASELSRELRKRLRITDEIGWRGSLLSVLLPETSRDGAEFVAKDISEVCSELELKFDLETLVYPDDDDIAAGSYEFQEPSTSNPPAAEPKPDSASEPESEPVSGSTSGSDSVTRSVCLPRPTPVLKRLIDIVGATFALTVFSPVLVAVAIAVKLDSPGPVLFKQRREGKDGRAYDILKFRTMRVGAHAEQKRLRVDCGNEQDGPAFKLTHDPRVTRVGRYLRKVCLDEMPQMLNVLKGDMSLVGPRPLPVDESADSKMWHRRRLEVLPGLTCIWQVAGRRDISFDEWMRMDLEYIERKGLMLDLSLLFKTVMLVVMHRGSV